MQIIFIKENQKNKWDEFIASNPNGSFLQSWAWGDFQEEFGRKIWRLAMMENNEIVSAALIIKHSLPFGWSYFYCPRPITKNNEQGTMNKELFFEEMKKIAGEEKAVFLKIDPVISCHCERSSNGARQSRTLTKITGLLRHSLRYVSFIPRNDCKKSSELLRRPAGLLGMIKKTKPIQPQHTLILDITKSEEEILARMKQKTRYNIRLAERKGVKIKKISQPNDQEIQTFLNLSSQTSKRDKFQIHPKEYYQKMLKILGANSMAGLFLAEYQNKIIAANIIIFFSDKAVYSHGASSDSHREAMAPYLLHWEQIKEAKKLGCQSYDFWGIEKIKNNGQRTMNKNWTGITRFKKGFGGEEISYPKSYDIIFDPVKYWIYRIGKRIL